MQSSDYYKKVLIFCVVVLIGCDSSQIDGLRDVSDRRVSHTLISALSNLVFVEGGTFMLGDLGSSEGVPHTTFSQNNKPPVEVTLDSFSISKHETTWGEFMVYLNDTGRENKYGKEFSVALQIKADDDPVSPNFSNKPARAPNFQEAQGFCQWLADKTGKPFALPTEAQWEYAARNRGKNVPYATNTGRVENDTYLQRPREHIDPSIPPSGNVLIHSSTVLERRVVGSYPSSPLGLYDMTGNVAEWTQDWYQEDYYQHMRAINPQGPESPPNPDNAERVVRDWAGRGENWGGGATVFVRSGAPQTSSANGFRCVVNTDEPIR